MMRIEQLLRTGAVSSVALWTLVACTNNSPPPALYDATASGGDAAILDDATTAIRRDATVPTRDAAPNQGVDAQVDSAMANPCSAGFHAEGGQCVSDATCPLACSGQGTCANGQCECNLQYTGEGCDGCAEGYQRDAVNLTCIRTLCDPDPCQGGSGICNPSTGICCRTGCVVGMSLCSDGNLTRCEPLQGSCGAWAAPATCGDMGCADENSCLLPPGIRIEQWGSDEWDNVRGVVAPGPGQAVVGGMTHGPVEGVMSTGLQDIMISFRSADSTQNWTQLWGSEASDYIEDIAQDADGNLLIVGRVGVASLSKHTSTGSLIWLRKWSLDSDGLGGTTARAVTQASDGSLFVTGYSETGLTRPTTGEEDAFFSKVTSDGDIEWSVQWGTDEADFGTSIAVDGTSIYIAGRTQGALAADSEGHWDCFLTKYEGMTHQWTKQWGSSGFDEATKVVIDANGHVLVAGGLTGTLQETGQPAGAFLGKWDPDGNRVWLETWGGSGAMARGLIVDATSAIWIAGSGTKDFDGEAIVGMRDVFLSKWIETAGNPVRQWSRIFGTVKDDHGHGLALDPTGVAMITGETQGAFPGMTLNGRADAFLMRIDTK